MCSSGSRGTNPGGFTGRSGFYAMRGDAIVTFEDVGFNSRDNNSVMLNLDMSTDGADSFSESNCVGSFNVGFLNFVQSSYLDDKTFSIIGNTGANIIGFDIVGNAEGKPIRRGIVSLT